MKLAILGPPGSGKGTQAPRIAEKLGIVHISTGDILRAAIREKTSLGQKAESYLVSGQLVPDEVMIEIVRERISCKDACAGFILDGFPRTIAQAEKLDEMDSASKKFLDWVVALILSEEECVQRIANRRTCPKCGASYNPITHPSLKGGACERCATELIVRPDDRPETVRARLKIYHQLTEPLIGYYRKSGRLMEVDASGDPETVFSKVVSGLKSRIPVGAKK